MNHVGPRIGEHVEWQEYDPYWGPNLGYGVELRARVDAVELKPYSGEPKQFTTLLTLIDVRVRKMGGKNWYRSSGRLVKNVAHHSFVVINPRAKLNASRFARTLLSNMRGTTPRIEA